MNIYNNTKETSQSIYDSYNMLMFSDDTRVFNKMTKKIEIYYQVKDLLGDIVEFGVFKGGGLAIFLKLRNMYEANSLTKIIGFDYFNTNLLLNELSGLNHSMMTDVVNRVNKDDLSLISVNKRLSVFNNDNYMLIQGDAVSKSIEFNNENPGARIKLLYMDIDLGEPTYKILITLWNKVVKGGIVVFDEYGYHKWDESDGVDNFLKEIPGQFKVVNTNIISPTMYIIKL